MFGFDLRCVVAVIKKIAEVLSICISEHRTNPAISCIVAFEDDLGIGKTFQGSSDIGTHLNVDHMRLIAERCSFYGDVHGGLATGTAVSVERALDLLLYLFGFVADPRYPVLLDLDDIGEPWLDYCAGNSIPVRE